MRSVQLFTTLFLLSCLVGASVSQSPTKDLVQLAVMFVELTLQHMGTIDLLKNITIPLGNNSSIIEGTMGFEEIQMSGLNALNVNRNNIDFNINGTIFSFCANLSIPDSTRLTIVEYVADIALIGEIPLYGKGNLMMGIEDIDFALCATIDIEKPVQLTDFLLKPSVSGLEFQLTGFWNNPQLSEAITNAVVSLEKIVMSFWANEIKCITCILSISIEKMINDLLNPNGVTKSFYRTVELARSDCEGDCVLSKYPFLKKIFNTGISFREHDNIRKFVYDVQEYLNQYVSSGLNINVPR